MDWPYDVDLGDVVVFGHVLAVKDEIIKRIEASKSDVIVSFEMADLPPKHIGMLSDGKIFMSSDLAKETEAFTFPYSELN